MVSFNQELIEYIVAHEMCHLIHANLSKDFYSLLENISARSEGYKKILKTVTIVFEKD